MPVDSGLIPRWNMITAAAPSRPNTAPDAPPCRPFGLEQQGAGRPAEHRGEVEQGEAHPTEHRLEQLAELEQQEHVEGEVDDPEVQEARRDQPVPLVTSMSSTVPVVVRTTPLSEGQIGCSWVIEPPGLRFSGSRATIHTNTARLMAISE